MTQLIEVGTKDKRMVTPLNKELYDLAVSTMVIPGTGYGVSVSRHGDLWHIGFKDVSEFINELEKRYDITPKQDAPDV